MRRRHVLAGIAGTVGAAGVLGGAAVLADRRGGGDAEGGNYEPIAHVDVAGARELVVGEDARTAYVAVDDGIASVDVSDPAAPVVLAEQRGLLADEPGGPIGLVWDVSVSGDRLLAAGPAQPQPRQQQRRMGAVLFDVSDPGEPVVVDSYTTAHAVHNCHLRNGRAYLTGNGLRGNPLVILSTDGDRLAEAGRWSPLDRDPGLGEIHTGLRQLHDVSVQDGVAYLPYWDLGTYVVDVADPGEPTYLGHTSVYDPAELTGIEDLGVQRELLQPPGNSHFVDVGDDGNVMAVGREAWAMPQDDCATGGPGGVDLYDVADPTAIERVGTIEAPSSFSNLQTGWFTTSHNLELTGGRLYSSWYFGGVRLHDVSSPSAPEELAWWRDPEEAAFWTARRGPGDTFLASSADDAAGYRDGIAGRVYVFPDRAGRQPSPPTLTEPPDGEQEWPEC